MQSSWLLKQVGHTVAVGPYTVKYLGTTNTNINKDHDKINGRIHYFSISKFSFNLHSGKLQTYAWFVQFFFPTRCNGSQIVIARPSGRHLLKISMTCDDDGFRTEEVFVVRLAPCMSAIHIIFFPH
jgi:hypothetical protein